MANSHKGTNDVSTVSYHRSLTQKVALNLLIPTSSSPHYIVTEIDIEMRMNEASSSSSSSCCFILCFLYSPSSFSVSLLLPFIINIIIIIFLDSQNNYSRRDICMILLMCLKLRVSIEQNFLNLSLIVIPCQVNLSPFADVRY